MQELEQLYAPLHLSTPVSFERLEGAVQLEIEKPGRHLALRTGIYEVISKQLDVSVVSVEKSIRYQRDALWGSPERRKTLCRVCYGGDDIPERPKPGEFVRMLAKYVTTLRAQETALVKNK